MQLIRFAPADGGEPRPGVLAAGQVVPLRQVQSMAALLALPVRQIRELCEAPGGDPLPESGVTLLAPVDGTTEVWAAGRGGQ